MKGSLQIVFRFFLIISLIVVTGCSAGQEVSPVTQASFVGGTAGGIVGAGTGGLIGAMIANGDIAASAMLGGAIGIPAGILIGAMYARSVQEDELDHNDTLIRTNQKEITQREQELEGLKQRLRDDAYTIELDEDLHEELYTGPSHGNYYR
ncbi:hypothetical protein OAO01_02860 [Oligoflexia bacterium]|nr:hypothetical protein [Oligoflexia bacterium]